MSNLSQQQLRLLYIEDSLADIKLLEKQIEKATDTGSVTLEAHASLHDASKALKNGGYDLVLLDLSLPDAHGLEGVKFLKENHGDYPVVVLTGNTDNSIALDAIKIGAQDYLTKGAFSIDVFIRVCNYAVERKKINTDLKKALNKVEHLNDDLRAVNEKLRNTVNALQREKERVIVTTKKINAFISTLVHDLKHPVVAVNSLTEMMLKESQKLTIPHIKYLNQIKHSSSSILDNILTLIETTDVRDGKSIGLELVYENPYFTMNATIDKYIVEAIQKNIIIVIGYRKELPEVYFDKRLLTNIMAHLLENSIAINDENTRLKIECELLDSGMLKVIFQNRGFFLYEEDSERVFEQDYEVASPHNEGSSVASGFKLSVMKKFVEMMGGAVGVNPLPENKGTEFWFTLNTQKPF